MPWIEHFCASGMSNIILQGFGYGIHPERYTPKSEGGTEQIFQIQSKQPPILLLIEGSTDYDDDGKWWMTGFSQSGTWPHFVLSMILQFVCSPLSRSFLVPFLNILLINPLDFYQ